MDVHGRPRTPNHPRPTCSDPREEGLWMGMDVLGLMDRHLLTGRGWCPNSTEGGG